MAVVRPFRAVQYAHEPGADISALTAPPYDVISPEQRERLLQGDARNVVALELPEGPLDPAVPGNRYETGGRRWREWRANGVLIEDRTEAVYVLEQRFALDGRDVRRRAFIAAVDLAPFADGVVLPHERTLPKALTDRLSLTRATAANLSQVLGLFSDPARRTDPLLDPATLGEPVLTATDADGVTSRLWAIRDPADLAAVSAALAGCRIFIADGHHRYTTALAYRDERRDAAGEAEGWHPYDGVMMALVNMDDPELVVLPTHRVADAEGPFDEAAFFAALGEHFDVAEASADMLDALADAAAPPTFVVKARSGAVRTVRLKDGIDPADVVPGNASDDWKALDVAVLQELVLRPLLGIHPDQPETLDRLSFVKDAEGALDAARDHDVVFLLRPTRMDQLRAVSLGGELMPQKSTYFYPKLLSGLVMRELG